MHGSGKVAVASINHRDPSGWKRYRGGMAARLYLSPDGEGDWRRLLPDITAGLFWPSWPGWNGWLTAISHTKLLI